MMRATLISLTLIVTILTSSLKAQVIESDSLALVEMYNSLDGPNWVNSTNWLSGPVGSWYGIKVEDERVTFIGLGSNGLKGTFPSSLNNLDQLKSLSFSNNTELTGPLPPMDNLKSLEHFYCDHIDLTGSFPEEIRALTALKTLDVVRCGITGDIPTWLPELRNLQFLRIGENSFNGEFPGFIRTMNTLIEIYLFDANLSGSIPDLSVLRNMSILTLGNNDFTGPFPSWITRMGNLISFNISGCQLTGEVTPNLFSNINAQFREFVIADNQFEGDVAKWMTRRMNRISRFEIHNNNFTGKMPTTSLNLDVISRWNVSQNELSGIPNFTNNDQSITWFYCDQNKLGFDHLETCLNLRYSRPDRFTLGPQKLLLDRDTVKHLVDATVTIKSGSYGTKDLYQWYKDGIEINGATDADLTIQSLTMDDYGTYHCVITNEDFMFDLERNPVTIAAPPVSNREIFVDDLISVQPNPAADWITLQASTDLEIDMVVLFSLDGKELWRLDGKKDLSSLNISSLDKGIYMLNIHTDKGMAAKRLVVER